MIEQCRNGFGLTCFGTAPNDEDLWQRYGGRGAGVCVEVQVPAEREIRFVSQVQAVTVAIDRAKVTRVVLGEGLRPDVPARIERIAASIPLEPRS